MSRSMVAAFATVLAALMLAAIGAYLFALLSPAAAPSVHIVAGQAGASGLGSAWNYGVRHSGMQSVEGPAAAAPTNAAFRAPTSGRSGPQS